MIRVCQFGKHEPQAGSEGGIGSPEFAGHDGNGGGQGTAQFRLAEGAVSVASSGAVSSPGAKIAS